MLSAPELVRQRKLGETTASLCCADTRGLHCY
ncbi:hypothetical protein CSHISOI_06145 [Colletotrichum shisoi]|uniref:Uncharacterized protein n=1 Tax=Colletotrichum shisoi TaxID=2078593 RepID=A0A5Q4BMC1_9PEZI|nr:hypothetical protein CSHISOI_06145 [Colletotrichum shisoi]